MGVLRSFLLRNAVIAMLDRRYQLSSTVLSFIRRLCAFYEILGHHFHTLHSVVFLPIAPAATGFGMPAQTNQPPTGGLFGGKWLFTPDLHVSL